MLQNLRKYIGANPLPYWLFSVVVAALIAFILFRANPEPRNPFLFMFVLCLFLSTPTFFLVKRLSAEQSIAPQQEFAVGLLSLAAWLCSLGAFGAAVLCRRWGLPVSRADELLMVFSGAAMLSLIMGYAARRTWTGRWGLWLTTGWLGLMVCTASGVFLWKSVFHL